MRDALTLLSMFTNFLFYSSSIVTTNVCRTTTLTLILGYSTGNEHRNIDGNINISNIRDIKGSEGGVARELDFFLQIKAQFSS